eukprot:NODE_778_length_4294_cov_0.265316.p1 type:complete len:451 gc:universal NODE_778_length_4294_cov_0.265316:2460-1108(-)
MTKKATLYLTVFIPLLAVLLYQFQSPIQELYFSSRNLLQDYLIQQQTLSKQLPHTKAMPEVMHPPVIIVEDSWSLNLFKTVAVRKGFVVHEISQTTPPKTIPNFRIFWLKVYPFQRQGIKDLIVQVAHRSKIGTKLIVNHWPGNGYFTSKLYMLGWAPEDYFPKGYFLGNQWDQFVKKFNEEKLALEDVPADKFYKNMPQWVIKGEHRDIEFIHSIEQVEEATKAKGKKSFMAQRFINNPFLIDNKKFDIGIYVLWTGVDPLEVFLFDEILLRFCPEEYGLERTSQYVIAEKYTYPWDMPSLKPGYEENRFSQKYTLSKYLKSLNRPECEYNELWKSINYIVRQVFTKSSQYMSEQTTSFLINNRIESMDFFEMVRFDFLVDDNCKVFMLEANMSPNLHPANLRQKNLFDNVIHKVLKKVSDLHNLGQELSFEGSNRGDFVDVGKFQPLQ